MIDRFDDLITQLRTKGFALLVDIKIVAAGKIDALKAALFTWQRFREFRLCDRAMTLDHHHVAWGDFLHIFRFEIETCHQRSALRCECDDLIALIIETGPDSRWVARHKGITITGHAANRVTTIPVLSRAFEHTGQIEIHTDMSRHLIARHAVVTQITVEINVLLIQEVADLFEHGLGIRRVNRMLAHGR